ncbi:MAG TPA: hypothetical protein VFJ58_25645 [Armatimonadota bacterium]|nr:hypothetical protein [Armatimonadota bacterium]
MWQLCESDLAEALQAALQIPDPWYRCQALAKVAWHTADRETFRAIINQAFDAAYLQVSPNRIVSVAAWPIHALAQREDARLAPAVTKLRETIRVEPLPVRRADALLLLFQAVFPSHEMRHIVLSDLVAACAPMNHWKLPYILRWAAVMLSGAEPEAAAWVIEFMPHGKNRRGAIRDIAAGLISPREFF